MYAPFDLRLVAIGLRIPRAAFTRIQPRTKRCKESCMARSLNPIFLAGIGAGFAAAAIAATRALRSTPPPDGAVVLITGGSRGLGYAIASRFARRPLRLVLAARDRLELATAQQMLLEAHPHLNPSDFYLVDADLTNPAECQRLIDEALNRFGRIDVLVNNAGIIEVGPAELQTLDAFDRAMDLHFYGPLHILWAALPHLRRQEPMPGWSRRAAIVNIASIGGKVAVPHMLPYTASKFALVGLSEGLHAELHKDDILVTTVCPGLMRSGGEEHAQFIGNVEAERRWFSLGAKTPILSASVDYAACRIYSAVSHGCAEITITPQAWLLARFAGHFPNTTQCLSALANEYILPSYKTPDSDLTSQVETAG
jgi:NAD(P)-dependent dehydrogenase (short-subunit alcohol dehydrogenase family)